MKIWQYSELSSKVEQDLATEEELFVQPSELLGYFNEGIDRAEQIILGLYEDYFLNRATLSITLGTEEYSLPSDIYAEKIRRVIYDNGSEYYTIDRIRDWKKFEVYQDVQRYGAADRYGYFLYNPSPVQSKFLLVPKARETGNFITIWYIRTATHFTGLTTDTLDLPEAANYIMKFVKTQVLTKEMSPNLPKEMADLDKEEELLTNSLQTMVPDANNEIEADMTLYEEMN